MAGGVKEQVITDEYAIYCGDSMEVLPTFPDESVHLSVYSPPFGGLYNYSSSERDLSNCRNYQEFFEMYRFFVDELHRLTMPGRLSGVHCMDVPSGNSGCDHQRDFPGDLIREHTRCRKDGCTADPLDREQGVCGHGRWVWTARYAVWKEPLGVRNRTMAKNLAHKTVVDDSSRCSVASADYLLMFRKRGENPVPIAHPTGLTEYAGSREIPHELHSYRGHKGNQIENRYSHWIWRQYASAFWDDVRIDRVLPFQESKDEDDERHVHPLQLDVIDRCIALWSNPNETVLTPFMGVGSEVYGAVMNGRRGVGVELKPSYYKQAVRNMEAAKKAFWDSQDQRALFAATT